MTDLTVVDQGHKSVLLIGSYSDGIDHMCWCSQALQEYLQSL